FPTRRSSDLGRVGCASGPPVLSGLFTGDICEGGLPGPGVGRPLRGPTMGRSVICAGRGVVLVLGPHSHNMLHPLLHPSNLLVRAQIPPLHTYITMIL